MKITNKPTFQPVKVAKYYQRNALNTWVKVIEVQANLQVNEGMLETGLMGVEYNIIVDQANLSVIPKYGDLITIDNQTYNITRIIPQNPATFDPFYRFTCKTIANINLPT